MRHSRSVLLILAIVFSSVFTGGTIASAAPDSSFGSSDLDTHGCSAELVNNDWRLGPVTLSNQFPVGGQVKGYNRFGPLQPSEFLDKYWDPEARDGAGGFKYPPENGYVLDANHQPIKHVATFGIGTLLDRYGAPGGNFLAPADTAYAARSLPPSNLVLDNAPETCNYHVYAVIKPLPAYQGQIAPWFEQPGLGQQIELVTDLIPANPECGTFVNVSFLLCDKYISQVYPTILQ